MEKAILTVLKKQPKTNLELRKALGLSSENYDPRLDRTLQKLRKSGKLKLIGNRWTVDTFHICPSCGGKGYVQN